MLVCARIGAIHSVVFGGFAPHELAIRIDDAKPKLIVSASPGFDSGRHFLKAVQKRPSAPFPSSFPVQRTSKYTSGSGFRGPCIWAFLNSLQDFFNMLLSANFQKRSFFDFLRYRQDSDTGHQLFVVKDFIIDFVLIIGNLGDMVVHNIAIISITLLYVTCDRHTEANQSRFA